MESVGIFATAKIAHLSDDRTVAKMGHPVDSMVKCGPPANCSREKPMRTVILKVATLMILLSLWVGLGCKRSSKPSHNISPGEMWLNMSIGERTQATAGFVDGYNLGTSQACGLLANVFEIRHSQQMNEEEIRSNLTDAQLCQRKAGMYSRINHDAASPDKYAAYVNVITKFYQEYSSQRDVPPFLLLLNMQDGFDSTVEQLHDSAGKSILRHH
jgi:hypothetical protein